MAVQPGPQTRSVRWNLHGDVSNIEDTKDGGELVSNEA